MFEKERTFRDAMNISSSLYGILAKCFSGEPSSKTIARMRQELEAIGQMKNGWDEPEVWREVTSLSDSLKGLTEQESARDYAGLFLGGREGALCPSESSYVDGAVYGPSTLRIMELYRNAGFVKESSFREPDDHIAVQFVFRFLSGLDMSEEMAPWPDHKEEVPRDFATQHEFVKDHLAVWIPMFARKVESTAATGFYRCAATLADVLVRADLRLHKRIVEKEGGKPPLTAF